MIAFDTTSEPAAQGEKRAHPTIVDKSFWMEKLLADKNLSQSAKLIGVRLALHHNSQNGRCFPTVETLMEGTDNSRATVHRGLQALKKAGHIDWKTGNSKWSNSYELRGVPTRQSGERPTSKVTHLRLATSEGMPVSEIEGPTVSSVRSSTVSSVRPKSLKSNPGKGYDEGRRKEEESQPSEASDSPASPLCLDGDGSSRAGEGEKQPEAETQLADGKLSFAEVATPEWIADQIQWARVQFDNDDTFITPTSKSFKRVVVEKGWRLTVDKWHEVWMSYSMGEYRKQLKPKPKSKCGVLI